jgi:hypothetical protein
VAWARSQFREELMQVALRARQKARMQPTKSLERCEKIQQCPRSPRHDQLEVPVRHLASQTTMSELLFN